MTPMHYKNIISVILITLLSSCSSQQERWNQFKDNKKSELERGYIKNSDYYISLYDEISTKSPANKSSFLRLYSTMIDASYDFEDGKISKRDFDSIKRSAESQFLTEKDEIDKALAQSQSQSLFNLGQQLQNMGTPMMYKGESECRFNPQTGRYQICISPSVRGCAGYGAGC